MKTQVKHPETVSHAIQGKSRAAKQADMHSVLQKYAQSVENGELKMESVQRQADNELDEELLQGKFETAQREALDDELLQGKFEAAENGELKMESVQRQVDNELDDELLQGKFETAQREALDDEEILQGKTVQMQKIEKFATKIEDGSGKHANSKELQKANKLAVSMGAASHGTNKGYIKREQLAESVRRLATLKTVDPVQLKDPLQGKFSDTAQRTERQSPPSGGGGATGIPDTMKSNFENLSGFSFDDVRVHYNSPKPAQLQALAYTQGNEVHIATGQEKHLGHELGHVVQQKQGRVQPTMQLQGVNVNDDEGLEREADMFGENAGKYSNYENIKFYDVTNVSNKAIQGKFYVKTKKKDNQDNLQDYYEWHPEEVNENLYINTGETKWGWIRWYPVYKERVLDLEGCPTTTSNNAAEEAKNSGIITDDIRKNYYFETTSNIYETLNEQQKKDFDRYIENIKSYCDTKGITSIIEGALKNVKQGSILTVTELTNETDLALAKEIFINRLKLMTEYVVKVGNQKTGNDNETIMRKYFIESTGSDPHANGEHALFLIERNNGNNRKLYKPHSLLFENMIMGNNNDSVISKFNEKLEDKKLPTMGFDTEKHTEDFISRVGGEGHGLTEEKIQAQFQKLGMLESLAATFGVTDLHGENVMFTEGGPIIVDGECGGWYGGTCIEGDLGVANIDEVNTLTNASAIYNNTNKQVFQENNKDNFDRGKLFGKNHLINNRDAIMEAYGNGLKNVDSFRVVPIPTSELAADLEIYVMDKATPMELAEERYQKVVNDLRNKKWAFNNKEENNEVHIEEGTFIQFYANALKAGTLPAFSFQLNTKNNIYAGSILLDGHVIGNVGTNNANELIGRFVNRANSKIDSYNLEFQEKIKENINKRAYKKWKDKGEPQNQSKEEQDKDYYAAEEDFRKEVEICAYYLSEKRKENNNSYNNPDKDYYDAQREVCMRW